ncbi:MAG TPA: sulfur carrier protein ThiS [Mycobacteriales bacterium]|nr:sulfur carrier protein ThiS [Mycobacteriales bacterium]HVX69317.1 sulfur carrier protein ThiS [Mycobacteriales bacterium]
MTTAITLNGESRELPPGSTVAAAVALLTDTDAGCAVAVNDEVVPRHDWTNRVLGAGDRVEVLTAVQGG